MVAGNSMSPTAFPVNPGSSRAKSCSKSHRVFGIAFLSSVLCGLPAAAPKTYPLGIRTSFLHGCITDGGARKNIAEANTRLCLCLLDKIQEQFAFSEFMAMAPALGQNQAPKNRLVLFIGQQVPHCLWRVIFRG